MARFDTINITSRTAATPLIRITEEMIEGSTFGADIADVEILMSDGSYCRFFLTAGIKNGRPRLEVSTNVGGGSRRKSVTGTRRKPEKRN
jgi:hypothetical protein